MRAAIALIIGAFFMMPISGEVDAASPVLTVLAKHKKKKRVAPPSSPKPQAKQKDAKKRSQNTAADSAASNK